MNAHFKVVLLIGPRQVGKSTLLQHCANSQYTYISLDLLENRDLAVFDPLTFLQKYPAPLIIDEAQYAPNLFNYIKAIVDRSPLKGQYWLTGSQKLSLMSGVSESLAGRVGVINIQGFSLSEKLFANQPWSVPADFTSQWMEIATQKARFSFSSDFLFETILRGSMPQMTIEPDLPTQIFFESYVQTYINRDLKAILRVENEMLFYRFLKLLAIRTSQLINYAEIARDLGVDMKTVQSWTSALISSGIIFVLEPYFSNLTSRLVKAHKIYFLDTGLCCFLAQQKNAADLFSGPMGGAMFETFVISEIVKSYQHNGLQPPIYFYRDKDQREVDLLIDQGNSLTPIEIKKSSNPSSFCLRKIDFLEKLGKPVNPGFVVCLHTELGLVAKDLVAVPVHCL